VGGTLSEAMAQELQRLRDEGCLVIGPSGVAPGDTPPTADASATGAGSHVQIRRGHRFVEGFGGTPDEAVRDALGKMEPYDPTDTAPGGPPGKFLAGDV
jgi:hypothetical protein